MLQAVAVDLASADVFFQLPEKASLPAPADTRRLAAALVGNNQLNEAVALLDSALQQHPHSEDLLAMLALTCEVRHDWHRAELAIEKLVLVQGRQVSSETLSHWVRVVRCQGRLQKALGLAQKGLEAFPGHALLDSEVQTLGAMLEAAALTSKA